MRTDEHKQSIMPYVSELLAFEKYFYHLLKKEVQQSEVKSLLSENPNLDALLQACISCLDSHISELSKVEQVDEAVVEKIARESAAGYLGSMFGVMTQLRSDKLAKCIRDCFVGFNCVACGYTMLHALSTVLQEEDISRLSLNHLKSITALVERCRDLIPSAVASELSATTEFTSHPALLRVAKLGAAEAWSSENIFKRQQELLGQEL